MQIRCLSRDFSGSLPQNIEWLLSAQVLASLSAFIASSRGKSWTQNDEGNTKAKKWS
jgi:hypothetical protein